MSRTKHHKSFGKDYSAKKYFVVPVGVSWWNHKDSYIIINDRYTTLKVKKEYFNTDNHWFKKTPSWWIKEMMTVPKRQKCRNWEKTTVKLLDIEDADICPDYGNKPHKYFW